MADDDHRDQIVARLREQLDQSRHQEQRLKDALTRVLDLFAAEASG